VGRDEATLCDSRRRCDIIVVANAGIGSTGVKLHQMTEPLWQETIDVNLSGVWMTVKSRVPHLLAGGRGGSIILTSSVAGLKTYPQGAITSQPSTVSSD
jgi:NAD(P)-dependent dehydrogenase (short-subunit alcohol dehydrogenase family)